MSYDSISGPQIQLTTEIQIGNTAEGKSAGVIATGLLPGTTVNLYIYSTPQLLGSALVDATGTARINAVIPPGLPAGDHRVVAEGTSAGNTPVQALSAFELNPQNIVVAYAPPAQVSQSLSTNQAAIRRALQTGRALYDIKLHPGAIATIALAAASVTAMAGVGGLSGFPRTGHSNSGSSGQGKLAGVVTKKLKGVKRQGPGIGDSSSTWKSPGTLRVDNWINSAVVRTGLRSALLPRVLVDGAWARAIFGSTALSLWVVGFVLGLLSSIQVHFQALPPRLSYVLAIIAVGLLDSAAGATAWLVIASLALFTGHLTNWSELRTILGLFVLFASTILLAHAIRPLRREQDGSLMHRFDRIADYVIPPIFLAFAASSMFKALNGLSGLELVHKSEFDALRLTVIIFFLVRMCLEDAALTFYPQRSLASQPAKLASQTKFATWMAIVGKLLLFLLITAPFFGLGFYTYIALALTALTLILKVFENKLPNLLQLNKWFPRGTAKFLLMLVVGTITGAWILGAHPSNQLVASTFALMLVPGIIATLLELFGREGFSWPESWGKRVLGIEIWLVALGIVVGFFTI